MGRLGCNPLDATADTESPAMRVIIRVDIGAEHGMGHAVRCRALAQTLATRGVEVRFVTRTPALAIFVAPFSCTIRNLGPLEDGDILLFDHKSDFPVYPWRQLMRHAGLRLVCIDPESTDPSWNLSIFPNAHQSQTLLDRGQREVGERLLAGWDYVMLAPDVTQQTPLSYDQRQNGPIVFCAGGSDPTGALEQMYQWATQYPFPVPLPGLLVFLIGASATGNLRKDYDIAGQSQLHIGKTSIEPFSLERLRDATLLVTTFGQTCYEALWNQTPALCLARTPEEAAEVQALSARTGGAVRLLGVQRQGEPTHFYDALTTLWRDVATRHQMSAASAGLFDGKGIDRVAEAVLGLG